MTVLFNYSLSVFLVTQKAYYSTVGENVTQGYLIALQCKKTYAIRKIETRCNSSLGHYFLPCLSKYVRNIYAGIWQKLIPFLVSGLFFGFYCSNDNGDYAKYLLYVFTDETAV